MQCDGPHAVAAAAAEKTKESQEPPRKRGRHANPTEGCVKVKRARFQIEPHFPETVFLKCAKDALLSVCAEKKKELGRKKDLGLKLSKEAAQVLQVAVEAALGQFFADANACTQHAKRVELWPADLALVSQLRKDDKILAGWKPQGPLKPP